MITTRECGGFTHPEPSESADSAIIAGFFGEFEALLIQEVYSVKLPLTDFHV